MKSKKNIFVKHRISANLNYISLLFQILISFKKCYKNYWQVFRKHVNQLGNITIIMKNGEKFSNISTSGVIVIASLYPEKKFNVKIIEDIIELEHLERDTNKKIMIKILGGVNNGDIFRVFLKDEYKSIPFQDKTIVDIGANIGDSSVYFAVNGASRVVGIEPFFKNFSLAKKNILQNNLSQKVEIIHAGCSDKSGVIEIDPDYNSNVDSVIKNQINGEKISSLTLDDIINKYKIPKNSILKMDCEGCEYESIISAKTETLEHFEYIFIEYHHGYIDLVKKLENSNFDVIFDNPSSTGFIGKYLNKIKNTSNNISENSNFDDNGYSGNIQAVRKKITR